MVKKVIFQQKPDTQSVDVDQWVGNRQTPKTEPTKRMTFDIPESLHTRVKSQCAIKKMKMVDVIRQLLEAEFPET